MEDKRLKAEIDDYEVEKAFNISHIKDDQFSTRFRKD